MSRVNQAQMVKLLDLLSEDGVLVHGRVSYVNTSRQNFWRSTASQLNSLDGGVSKNTWKWCKMWADWKNKTKRKADIMLHKIPDTYGQHPMSLTNLELRLLKLIEYPMEDILNAQGVSKAEMPETTTDEIPDFLTESYATQLNQKPMSSDEEDNTVLGLIARGKSKLCNVDEVSPGTKFKKRKASLEEYKLKTTLALERERVQQKSEELRLRAVELKLKGDELRLKEIEMNKINHLTNIEEEKLKCFRDISSSLKELLDRTTNGNVRFHNLL